jgi:pre-mRNA-splicing factor ATP-dependent RNA helicase DHX15/PRP43
MTNNKIGILDPEGININPLNNSEFSDNYKKLAKKWKELPTYQKSKEILKNISEQNILLVQSGTGSGKSVIIPKLLLHHFNYNKKLIMILPKQILTKSGAEYASNTLDVKLGEQIGYKYKGEKKYSEKTKLLYTTDGTLVAMLLKDPELKEYSGVVLDEAHERRTQTDFLLYLLKQVCLVREDFKFIIMSATINKNIFSDYFFGMKFESMEISGKSNYPIESIFLQDSISSKEYMEKGLEIINKIINETKTGDIIFFVPSIQETFQTCKKFIDSKQEICVEVFAGMNKQKEELAIDAELYKQNGATRKIIIATNVAESSMTIDGIKYVIDSGYENFGFFDAEIESKVIEKRMISKAQIKQRMGRSGRTSSGTCYHLYTKKDYGNTLEYPLPAIQTSNIYSECLNLMNIEKINNIKNLKTVLRDFIEPPKEIYISYSEKILMKLGLIEKGEMTQFGKIIAQLPTEPMAGVAIYNAYKLNCAKEVIMIISMCEVIKNNISELFQKIDEKENNKLYERLQNAKNKLKKHNSDHCTLLNIIVKYKSLKKKSQTKLDEWLYSNFIKKDAIEKAIKYYHKMKMNSLDILQKNNIKNIENNDKYENTDKILASFYSGYFMNTVTKSGGDKYNTDKINNVNVSKESFINTKEKKSHILYNELLTSGNKTNMQICSVITNKIIEIINVAQK